MPTTLQVVGAAILSRGRCLAARRGPTMTLAGQWEFPGGKVERGESPVFALQRELREELGIEVSVGEVVGRGTALHGRHRVELTVFTASLTSGTPEPREHAEIGWFTHEQLTSLRWAAADIPVVGKVQRLLELALNETHHGSH